ncbi:MAG: 2-dehydro-3-deoxygalactonokinase [Acetobacteraceae bacterium]|nr:2-dehydro-3-deoxygalactonokinase [Acetobacteraceae bacterium]
MGLPSPRLIALDWGTSALRAYLLADDATVLDVRSRPWGIMHLPPGGFPAAFHDTVGDWRDAHPGVPAIAAGMVGSAQGWVEAAYCPCPAGPQELARVVRQVDIGGNAVLHIIPGVEQRGAAPNVMRGEETQIVGALGLDPALRERALLVLPGTHCKWVDIRAGRIERFETFMTGELFSVLCEHTILGRPARAAEPLPAPAWPAFARGVDLIREAGERGLAPNLFLARSLVLNGTLQPAESLDFLSGLLIGEELRVALRNSPADSLVLIGEAALCGRYQRAFAQFGYPDVRRIENVSPAGLWHIAAMAGLLGASASSASPETTP